ncbi:lysine-specific demethylase 5D isoform X1 [Tanacetum coccineum]
MQCNVYSGTVAGTRKAFFCGVPSISISYDWFVVPNSRQSLRQSYVPQFFGVVNPNKFNNLHVRCSCNVAFTPEKILAEKVDALRKMSMSAARNEKELLLNQLELGAMGTIGRGSTDAFNCVEMDMVVSEVQRVKEWKRKRDHDWNTS